MGHGPAPFEPGRRGGRQREQSGSAVVAALAIALVVAVVASSVMARSVGAVAGASGAHDRLEARVLAEDVLHETMRRLDHEAGQPRSLPPEPIVDERPGVHIEILEEDDGVLAVRVEASVGVATAEASARLRARSVADFALVTESLARDPRLHGTRRIDCAWPIGDPRRDASCEDMPMPVEPPGGPVHSNDLYVTDAVIDPGRWMTSSATDVPGQAHRPEVALPRDVRAVLGERPPTCTFRGPTLLRFDGPRVRVTSPRSVPYPGEPLGVEASIGCLGIDRTALDGVVVVDLPERAVILVVDDVRDDCVEHPLGIDRAEDRERDWRCDAGDAFVWGRYHGARTVLAEGSIQLVWDLEPGDAAGPRPLNAGDVLGLVAADSVVLRRPVVRNPATRRDIAQPFAGPHVAPFGGYPLDAPNATTVTWDDPRIVAAIATLRGSLAPQNLRHGPDPSGATTIVGAVAGRFAPAMNAAGASGAGDLSPARRFPLAITYDARFDRTPPPAMPHIDGGRLRIVELDVG